MPKLIIDEDARKILLARLPGQPVFTEPNGSLFSHGVVDLIDDNAPSSPWLPSNELARGIVLGSEACKDIVFHAERFKEIERRGRTIKAMSVPVCSLMDVLASLMAAFNTPDWRTSREAWPAHDQDAYRTIGRRLRKTHMTGPVRKIRHKLGAHLDFEAAHGDIRLSANELLCAMGDSLIILMLMLNHPGAFSWIRPVGILANGEGRVVDTMAEYPLCLRWLTDMEGHVKDVGCIRLAADPRHDVQPQVLEAIETYNMMVKEIQSSLRSITCVPTEERR